MELSVPHYVPPAPNYRRAVGFGAVVLVHVLVIYALQSGLARMLVDKIKGPMETRLIEEVVVEKEEPPPPPPKFQPPPPVYVAMPEFAITQESTTSAITASKEPPKVAPPPPVARVVIPPRTNPRRPNTGAEDIYPAMSKRLGEEGTVILLLTVSEEGRVTDAKVQTTSGFDRLDEAAAKEAVRAWRFLPGTIDGKVAAMQMPLKVTFKIGR